MQELKTLVTLLKAAKSLEKRIESRVSDYGLSLSEFMALEALYHSPEDLAVQTIAKKVLLTSGSMTYVINRLGDKDLIERVDCPQDRRIIYVRLSDKGRMVIAEAFIKHEQDIQQLFSAFSEEELSEYIRLNKKLGLSADLD